jgi:hypothetical protein
MSVLERMRLKSYWMSRTAKFVNGLILRVWDVLTRNSSGCAGLPS